MLSVHKTISTVGELSVLRFYVIDIAACDKISRKGKPAITRSVLRRSTRSIWRPYLGADLSVMDRDAKRMRGDRPFLFTNLKEGAGAPAVVDWLCAHR